MSLPVLSVRAPDISYQPLMFAEDYFMKDQSSHNWLYQTKTFASLYERIVGEATSIVFWRELKERFLDFIPEGGRILEIGSGPGFQAIKICQYRRDLEIIASDFSSEMISLGKKNYQELILQDQHISRVQSHLSFVQADAMDLSHFDSETFDGIYSVGAIKHFPAPIRGLNECIRILKPGGRMFFSEFFAEASVTDIMNLVKHVRIPGLLKPTFSRFLHNKHKKLVPDKADIEKWENELSSKGFPISEYLPEYPFFILKFDKK